MTAYVPFNEHDVAHLRDPGAVPARLRPLLKPGGRDALDAAGGAVGRLRPTLFAYRWLLVAEHTTS